MSCWLRDAFFVVRGRANGMLVGNSQEARAMAETTPQARPNGSPTDAPKDATDALDRSARWRLSRYSLPDFAGDTLFDAVGRVVAEAECLPRKELFESWEVANRVRRRVRGRPILDLAAGHGLVAWLLLLDPTAPGARCVDRRKPRSAERLEAALTVRWPRLAGKVRWEEGDLRRVTATPADLVVSVHACGVLTDRVLDVTLAAGAAMAVLPCCHNVRAGDTAGLEAWMDGALAVDAMRALRLRGAGYRVFLLKIPEAITPQNRLLIGVPEELEEIAGYVEQPSAACAPRAASPPRPR
jgi:hypothetical protein